MRSRFALAFSALVLSAALPMTVPAWGGKPHAGEPKPREAWVGGHRVKELRSAPRVEPESWTGQTRAAVESVWGAATEVWELSPERRLLVYKLYRTSDILTEEERTEAPPWREAAQPQHRLPGETLPSGGDTALTGGLPQTDKIDAGRINTDKAIATFYIGADGTVDDYSVAKRFRRNAWLQPSAARSSEKD